MKKLNNKGMTLMELLVSIVLVSMVLVFLVQLVADLKNETNNNNYSYTNQVNRTDAIYTIQKDLMDYDYILTGVKSGTNTATQLQIFFYYQDASCTSSCKTTKTATMTAKKVEDSEGNITYYLTYSVKDDTTTNYSWEMKGATIDMCGDFSFYETTDNYYFKLNIYLYNSTYHERNNAINNNAVDDIEITYEGESAYLTNSSGYLTSKSSGTYTIGTCS